MAAKGGAGAGAYVQVVGLSALATRVQLERLFGLAGPVTSLQTFWLHDPGEGTPGTLLGYVKYEKEEDAKVAEHMNEQLFLDRMMIVTRVSAIPPGLKPAPCNEGGVAVEREMRRLLAPKQGAVPSMIGLPQMPGMLASGGMMPRVIPDPVADRNVDPTKVDEIRRTLYVGNLGPSVDENLLLQVFGRAGQIRFVRISGEPSSASRFAFVEFTEHAGAMEGLKLNGQMIGDRPVKVNLSKNAVVKSTADSRTADLAAQKALEAAAALAKAVGGAPAPAPGAEAAPTEKKGDDGPRERSRERESSRGRDRESSRDREPSRERERSRDRRDHRRDYDDYDRRHDHDRRGGRGRYSPPPRRYGRDYDRDHDRRGRYEDDRGRGDDRGRMRGRGEDRYARRTRSRSPSPSSRRSRSPGHKKRKKEKKEKKEKKKKDKKSRREEEEEDHDDDTPPPPPPPPDTAA